MSQESDIFSVLANSKEAYATMIAGFRVMESNEHAKAIELAEAALFNPALLGAAQRQKGRHEMLKDVVLFLERYQKKGA